MPPAVMGGMRNGINRIDYGYPVTTSVDWCGEWKERG